MKKAFELHGGSVLGELVHDNGEYLVIYHGSQNFVVSAEVMEPIAVYGDMYGTQERAIDYADSCIGTGYTGINRVRS